MDRDTLPVRYAEYGDHICAEVTQDEARQELRKYVSSLAANQDTMATAFAPTVDP